jgi:hypothetical protein
MTYPKIKAYQSYYITIGDSLDDVIESLSSIKNDMTERGMTTVKIDDVDEYGHISVCGERVMTKEEETAYDEKYKSREAIDRTTYVELKLKYGWS